MTSGESPAVARRRLRLALRRARETAGLTQAQVAEEMEWSVSKVMRIESGEVTISVNDAKLLLPTVGITDRAVIADLLQAARAARQRREWWDEPRFREHLPSGLRQLVQFEIEAKVVRYFCPALVPGRIQTDAYAKAIIDTHRGSIADERLDVVLEARARRRNELSARKTWPTVLILLDESVLHRQIGGAQTLADQLNALRKLVSSGRIVLRILPFTEVQAVPTIGYFEIFYLTERGIDGEGDAVMYREGDREDEIIDDPAEIRRHLETFEKFWEGALDETMSSTMLDSAAKTADSVAARTFPE